MHKGILSIRNGAYLRIFGIVLLIFLYAGCEDVIDVELADEPPRLIVNALMRVDTTQEFIPVKVRVSTTNNFFEEIPVTALDRIVIVIEFEEDGIITAGVSNLAELEPGSGEYFPDPNFSTDQRIPTSAIERDLLYTLIIEHEGNRYAAQTRYVPAVPITGITQGTGTLLNEDETEVIVRFEDDPEAENFYIFDFDFDEYLVTEDEFYQGQEFEFSYFYDRQFESGKNIEISILGADKTFYDYMARLLEQTEDVQNPFQTPAATVRGNVFDITGLDNINIFDNVERPNSFPLGYFAIVQEYKQTLTIE